MLSRKNCRVKQSALGSVQRSNMKKFTAYVWAFLALLIVFVTVGFATLGSVKTTGDSVTVKELAPAYYALNLEDGQKLDEVYVNVGVADAKVGESVSVTVETNTSSTASTSGTWSKHGDAVVFTNVGGSYEYAKQGVTYNWLKVHDATVASAKKFRISFSKSTVLNELVCLDQNGERIEISPLSITNSGYTTSALAKACDKQSSFTKSASAYYNLGREESIYMASAQNILSGRGVHQNTSYVLDNNYNYLSSLIFAGSVGLFGESVFALRVPVLLAATAILVFAYLLVREMTKSDKYSFIFALLFALGGVLLPMSRFAAPYTIVASALLGSLYFAYKFYAKGISSKHVIKGGLNVLYSGLFAAVAMAIDASTVLPVIGILVLGVFGLRRQKAAYKVALAKTEGMEETVVLENGESKIVNKAAARERAKYDAKNRICWGFAILSFVLGTLALMLLSSVLCYFAYVKAGGSAATGYVKFVAKGALKSVRSGNIYWFANNGSSVWSWWLPLRAATLYAGVNGVGENEYLAWNVAPNILLSFLCLAAVIFVTVKVAMGFVQKTEDKKALKLRRTYFILLGGMAATMLMCGLKVNVSAIFSLAFQALYLAFLPLTAKAISDCECGGKGKKIALNVAIWTVVAAVAILFFISLPSVYGFKVSAAWGKCFGWTTFVSNGYFR